MMPSLLAKPTDSHESELVPVILVDGSPLVTLPHCDAEQALISARLRELKDRQEHREVVGDDAPYERVWAVGWVAQK